jgi:hypothetical protein
MRGLDNVAGAVTPTALFQQECALTRAERAAHAGGQFIFDKFDENHNLAYQCYPLVWQ